MHLHFAAVPVEANGKSGVKKLLLQKLLIVPLKGEKWFSRCMVPINRAGIGDDNNNNNYDIFLK